MQLNEMRDTTSVNTKFSISESSEVVSGFHTLAKVKGVFFVPNGISRNNRFYTRNLWEKQLARPEVKERMSKRVMFGTIGHDLEINDKALREGLVSHIVTNAYIDDAGQGIGEAYVLDTPAGKALNAILRAGCELNVSSRANGTFDGEKNGVPMVSEDAYDLSGWDFVLDAGFLQAHPKLVESLNNLNFLKNNETISTNKEKSIMSGENTAKLNEDLVKATLNENADLKNKIKTINEELEEAKADADTKDKENKDLQAQADELKPKLEKLSAYESLGSPEEIKALKEGATQLTEFLALGDSPVAVQEALEKAVETVEGLSAKVEGFEEKFGKEAVVEAALVKSIEEANWIKSHGGKAKIEEAIKIAGELLVKNEAAEADKKASELAEAVSLPKEKVVEMLKTMTEDQIKLAHSTMAESLKGSSFVKKDPVTLSEGNPAAEGAVAPVSEVISERFNRVNAAFT